MINIISNIIYHCDGVVMKKEDSKSNLNLDICRIIDYILRIIIILMIIIKLINQQYNDIGILLLTFFSYLL